MLSPILRCSCTHPEMYLAVLCISKNALGWVGVCRWYYYGLAALILVLVLSLSCERNSHARRAGAHSRPAASARPEAFLATAPRAATHQRILHCKPQGTSPPAPANLFPQATVPVRSLPAASRYPASLLARCLTNYLSTPKGTSSLNPPSLDVEAIHPRQPIPVFFPSDWHGSSIPYIRWQSNIPSHGFQVAPAIFVDNRRLIHPFVLLPTLFPLQSRSLRPALYNRLISCQCTHVRHGIGAFPPRSVARLPALKKKTARI